MKKSKAIVILLCFILITLGVAYIDIAGVDASGKGSASDIKLGLDLAGGASITYQVVGDENPDATAMSDTIYKLQQRVEKYSTEAIVYQEGTNRINIDIPGVDDANEVLQELGKPGALYFIAETDNDGNPNYSYSSNYEWVLNKSIEELKADSSIVLEGTDVKTASAATQQDSLKNSEYVVQLVMNDEGTVKFAQATERAYNKGERLGIYYDGKFVSVPSVNGVFTNGEAIISPMSSYEEAEKLASTIRIGGLSLELEDIHSKVVGAQLGVEAISTSLKAGMIGLIIVIVLMIAIYFIPGLAASLALVFYTAFTVMLIKGFELTLTLSGIAGIILSIGMAVDANVIIFARIREELATGKSVKSAIKIGYDKALSSIIDGNVTTLIAAAVLLFLAPGSVKGFAQTLALGIAVSLFTSLLVTRWIMNAFFALGIKNEKWYGVGRKLPLVKFVEKRGIFFAVSLAIIVAGFITMGVFKANTGDALNYSLEFKGGTQTSVTFNENYSLEEATSVIVPKIEKITGSAVQVQTVQDSSEVIFKTSTLDAETRIALDDMFKEDFGVAQNMIQSETISSTISDEMKSDTIISVIVAVVCMLIYIRIRFKDIRFGISSVACLVHDVLVVLAFYAFARISVSNTFIACMLTIVGYSINATIVIFDRVRENMATMGRRDAVEDVLNRSITDTLSRSIFTSLTTFVMVAFLYVFGVTSIKDFALPLMVGIVCGAFSSVCLASALWYVLKKAFPGKAENR